MAGMPFVGSLPGMDSSVGSHSWIFCFMDWDRLLCAERFCLRDSPEPRAMEYGKTVAGPRFPDGPEAVYQLLINPIKPN